MSDQVDQMIDTILQHEGGYVNNPADRGGPTNFGITQATLSRFLQRAATIDDVKRLDIGTARDIYELNYFRKPRIDKLPEPIQQFVFDCAVNHGPRRAIRFVQHVCSEAQFGPLAADGLMGPKTKAVVAQTYEEMGDLMLIALIEERVGFYNAIVKNNSSQKQFLKGWLRRARSFLPDTENA